ncbi:CAMK family protein kinase [Tritrichomonas foetus]|uniref:CAMK family protein kinase n=1 Tax=Tritrichomonas foetus TaxID=1144522 RepID=A0A1J4JJH7_9EUKA|nr:CAMK family protein kinase [Tritrichomonas foetus]|eukprot:OHS98495.1 CAMK family protein kinase [Tritrichomonas foetus]
MKEVIHPTLGTFTIKKVIGHGSYATVYLAIHEATKMSVALKVYSKGLSQDSDEMLLIKREVDIMKDVWHPLVVSLFDCFEYNHHIIFISEFIEGENLLDYANGRVPFPESEVRQLFAQMILILEYVHKEKKIVHRDLKCENFMVDLHNNIHLIDFGFANYRNDNHLLKTTCGSPGYIAPEIIRSKPYDQEVDIWSLGIILYAITHGHLPFDESNTSKLLTKIVFSEPEYDTESFSPDLIDLIQSMLKKDPKERATIDQIKNHPWLTIDENSRNFTLDDTVYHQYPVYGGFVNGKDRLDPWVAQYLNLSQEEQNHIIQSLMNFEKDRLSITYSIVRKYRIYTEMATVGKMIFKPVIVRQPKRVSTFGPNFNKKLPVLMVRNNEHQSNCSDVNVANFHNPSNFSRGSPNVGNGSPQGQRNLSAVFNTQPQLNPFVQMSPVKQTNQGNYVTGNYVAGNYGPGNGGINQTGPNKPQLNAFNMNIVNQNVPTNHVNHLNNPYTSTFNGAISTLVANGGYTSRKLNQPQPRTNISTTMFPNGNALTSRNKQVMFRKSIPNY